MTHQGSVSFISKGWSGTASDKYITEHSGHLNNLLPGDIVLDDHGFDLADSVAIMGTRLDLPAFSRGQEQFSVCRRSHRSSMSKFHHMSNNRISQQGLGATKIYDGVLLNSIVRVC